MLKRKGTFLAALVEPPGHHVDLRAIGASAFQAGLACGTQAVFQTEE
jgi:hypothetical protein